MNLIKDLKDGVITLQELTENLGIKIKEYDDRIVLNYCQIESPKSNEYVMQSRGLILKKNTYEVLCLPFDRFFNFGEVINHDEIIDWKECLIYEKVDGSLIKVYHDGEKWCIATRGTAFAESEVGGWGVTFEKLVLKSLNLSEMGEFQNLCNSHLTDTNTYLFEVTARENRVVTNYEGYTLWYLGTRCKVTGDYLRTDKEAEVFGARLPKVYNFSNSEECMKTASNLPDLQEGYVVYNGTKPFCKIKSPAYVAVHHLRGEGLNPKRIAELVLTGEQDEYLKYFPEDEEYVRPYTAKIYDLQKLMLASVNAYGDIKDQKEFALKVKDFPFSAVLFQWKKKGGNVVDIWNNQPLNYKRKLLLNLVGEKDE